MKCIDCKFCAFINEENEEVIVKSNGVDNKWHAFIGAYCMKITCAMIDVDECSGYEKSKHRKIKSPK